MGIVVQFRRPVASAEVIAKLVELGYLRPAKRHKAGAVEKAVERLRADLHRDGVIRAGDLSLAPKQDRKADPRQDDRRSTPQGSDDAPPALSSDTN